MGATLSCPLFSTRAFWSPPDVPQLQNTVQLNNPTLSASRLPLAAADHTQLVHKVGKAGGSHAHAHAPPTLAAADEHPEEEGEFQHHSGGRFGAVGRCFQLRNKKDVSREKSWTPLIRRVDPPLANALPRLLDAFLDARSRSKRVHRVCAALRTQMLVLNDPPGRVMEAQL